MARFMTSGKITSKGQITLPKIVRDNLGAKAGDSLFFIFGSDGNSVTIMKTSTFLEKLDKLHDIIKKEIGDKIYTDEEIQEWVNEVRYGKKK